MNSIRDIAMELVESLVALGINKNLTYSSFENWCYDNSLEDKGFWWGYGLTKACIGHDSLPGWILKVGFSLRDKKDYATIEYENYCSAEEEGVSEYFPKTIYLCESCDYFFYLQKEAFCDEEQISSDWYEKVRAAREENGEKIDEDSIWNEVEEQSDSERIMNLFHDVKLLNFLNVHRIGDFHEGNFGYIDGTLVIVDFSGYNL